ncbi:MAG TPA: asparaginase [Drouetiella sp.]
MTEIAATNVPWLPLYTIDRSGITEVEVYGIISIVEGTASGGVKSLLRFGDVNYRLWSRSLLKPWQLLSHFREVVENYPQLNESHLTLMMSSHSAELTHLKLLDEIMSIGQVSDELLKCPATYPLANESRIQLKSEGQPPRSLYHNCSGKHFGYLMALKAAGHDMSKYTEPAAEHFVPLKELLVDLTQRPESDFEFATTDGCQLPNYSLSPQEMAVAYLKLACGMKTENKRAMQLTELGELMRAHPQVIGGVERFDSRLMGGLFADVDEVPVVAKEGADGLLGIGIGPNKKYPFGLGILIKLSSGNDTRHMQAITKEAFRQLDILKHKREKAMIGPPVRKDHIKTNFNFEVSVSSAVQL